jgi:hypothetical protein
MQNIKSQPEPGRGYQQAALLFTIALSLRIFFLFHSHNTGTDAWARYTASLLWAQHPDHIPSEVWLPLPFWILGAVLRFWPSEVAARVFTLLVGAATILPFYGLAKKLCTPRGAFYSTLLFACLGLHIGYSLSTSSESPTLLFLIGGIYCWLRFRSDLKVGWFFAAAIALNAAALCRYEIWVLLPLIAVLTMLDRGPANRSFSLSKRLTLGVATGVALSIGSVAWSLFCLWKWGDPLAQAHQTVWLNAHRPAGFQPGDLQKYFAVPADLVGSLGPVVAILSLIGLVLALRRRTSPRWDLAVIALIMASFHAYNAAAHGATMARYTLMYSWLFIMLCFYGLEAISAKWSSAFARAVLVFTVTTFVLWQSALVLGAQYAPCRIADKLGSVSAALPLRCELRELLAWLNTHLSPSDSVVVDDMAWESTDVVRYSKVAGLKHFRAPYLTEDTAALLNDLGAFVQANHPGILIYSPKGQLGRIWPLPAGEAQQSISGVNLQLCEVWQNDNYRVYQMNYDQRPCKK